ncbi:sulfotransferase [Pseudooceanicola sp. 502str34]
MRVVLHAGFHKTGTSSVQAVLAANRGLLAPGLRIWLKPDIRPLTEACRAFSEHRDDLHRGLLRYEAQEAFGALDASDPRPLLISAEDLAGHMPFRRGLTGYDAAPELLALLTESLHLAQPTAEPVVYLSTRSPEAWVKSCHAQHLQATRMRLDLDSYRRRALAHADLAAVADAVAEAIAPLPLHRAALEAVGHLPLGPLAPLLDLVALPEALRARIVPQPTANPSLPAEVLARLLQMNQSDWDGETLKRRKKRLIRRTQEG